MEALEAISARRSTRSFRPGPLPRPVIERIVDAARLAATENLLVAAAALGHEKHRAERAPKRAIEDILHWERWKR